MRRVKQFRYYGENNAKNSPVNATMNDYINGTVFSAYYPIIQLGIQAMPGAEFCLNSPNRNIIGYTGIYELDLNGQAEITTLSFPESTMENINKLNNALLIVDIVYDDGEVEV